MNPNSFFGISSILCFCLPVVAIIFYRLYRHISLIALLIYYALTIIRCLQSSVIPPVFDFKNFCDVAYTYIEVPLMLTALLFFCPVRQNQQKIHLVIVFFLAYEVMVAIVYGFTPTACLFITAPGLIIIVSYSVFLFLRQLKFSVVHGKNIGRVLMLGAVVFSYSCYLFMFYAYFILQKPDVTGIYILYFISSTIASVFMSIGLFLMRHRIKELQELKVARRELQMVFG